MPCSLAGLGNINWTCPAERRRFLFWVRTLFRLGLYLFRCKSVCKSVTSCPCVVGGGLVLICWRKSDPSRLELCRLFSIIRLLLMWEGDIMLPRPHRQRWWERAYLLFITQHSEEDGLVFMFHPKISWVEVLRVPPSRKRVTPIAKLKAEGWSMEID